MARDLSTSEAEMVADTPFMAADQVDARQPDRTLALVLEGIDKRFPGVHALKDVTLSVAPGEILGLVGENGAGKSTLMAIAAGSLNADAGTVTIDGQLLDPPSPKTAAGLGLSIVYQEPALMPDLRVDENLYLSSIAHHREKLRDESRQAAQALSIWPQETQVDPSLAVRDLAPDGRFIVEIAKAISQNPKVLILDEPTEHLNSSDAEALLNAVRDLAAGGCAIVYISHRIHEVKSIADRIAVLRDGAVQGTFRADEVSEEDVIRLIVGRELDRVFPAKTERDNQEVVLECTGLSTHRLSELSFALRKGEIVGLAGIQDQGQRDVLRALAGLEHASGTVTVDGRPLKLNAVPVASRRHVVYLPSDRHREGLFHSLSVRENVVARVLRRVSQNGIVRPDAERREANRFVQQLRVRTPNLETRVSSLSGGNQQKVMIGRALSAKPAVILADEPTQGVDVGARSEIYDILHSAADDGAAALVVSSDAAELAGLCTRVLVFSRGRVVRELKGDEVTEDQITGTAITATGSRESDPRGRRARRGWLYNFLRGDHAPSVIVALAIIGLGAYAASKNSFYFTTRNFTELLTLFAALAFVAIAQQLVMMVGAIDLSVGPLMGFMVVVGSFVTTSDSWPPLIGGLLLLIAIAVAVGALNWTLAVIVRITPMIATLITYTLLQGVSLLLRPTPGGTISNTLINAVSANIGFIPVAAIVAALLAIGLEFGLYRSAWGLRLRAVGSNPGAADRNGVRNLTVLLGAYIACAVTAFLAGLLLMAQVGSGDPSVGTSYTLPSITAVVLGGASVFGGRGSFVGALLGALMIQQLNTVTAFLHLNVAWQDYLLGGLTLVAVGFYSFVRRSK
jgi:ribose transport system ATP-binding protein